MEDFKFNLVGAGTQSPFGGYVSEVDKTTLARPFMVKGSKNVYRKRSGAIAARPGLMRRGAADSTLAPVLSSFEWYTSLGTVRPLRVANGKLEVESDIVTANTQVWYTLLSSLTNTRLIFDTWWDDTAKKDILLYCDGTDSMKYWSGAIALLSSAGAATITFASNAQALGFQSSGTVIINGTEYTYSGRSGTDLTGVSPTPVAEAVNSVVLQKPETDSDTVVADFEIDFIKVVKNQLVAASDSSRLVYISKNSDWDDFTKSSPRATGEGDTLTLDESPLGIGDRDGTICVATKKAWYEVTFEQITVGSALSEQTKVKKRSMTGKRGALRHEFIANVGDDLIYLSEDQQLMFYADVPNVSKPKFPSLSEEIRTELKNEDFTNGHIRAIGDFIYLTAPNSGRVWLRETVTRVNEVGEISEDKLWHPPFIWNLSRVAEIEGVEYGHSNSRPQIYQLWDTLQWHDDSPSDESIPYDAMAVFSYRTGNRFDLIEFEKVYFEGYMTPGSNVSGAVTYEYQGELAVQSVILNDGDTTPDFYIGDIGTALGDAALGDNPLGDQASDEERDQELLPKFRIITDVALQHCHEYQVRVYSTEAGARWELLCFGANEQVSEEKPVSLRV